MKNWTNKKKGWKKCYARRIHCSNLMGKTKQKLHKKRTKQKQKEKWESNETEKTRAVSFYIMDYLLVYSETNWENKIIFLFAHIFLSHAIVVLYNGDKTVLLYDIFSVQNLNSSCFDTISQWPDNNKRFVRKFVCDLI